MTFMETAEPVQSQAARPEYPRPDWQRHDWLNLNGSWEFMFDGKDEGLTEEWYLAGGPAFDRQIQVPFSWVSPLSGIGEDVKGTAWYAKRVKWSPSHKEHRVFLRFGAVDYRCRLWVNQIEIGTHEGGYGSFEFDITEAWKQGEDNRIVLRVQDDDEAYQTRGKQGYGELRGIWQTVWLEARPQQYIASARFVTKIDGTVEVEGMIEAHRSGEAELRCRFDNGAVEHRMTLELAEGGNAFRTSFQVEAAKLWTPETPYLYEGTLELGDPSAENGCDRVATYFGIREIGSAKFGGRGHRWITLNGKPVFLSGTLDQSFIPDGYFTFPSEDYIRDEIWRLKRLGLNFVRIHIKPEEPVKLYWADKLGMLVMEDMPCFWGEPDEKARTAYEREAREIIERDFNHPSIISWVVFNETWGLFTKTETGERRYLPETQEWVRSVYRWAKSEDPTRLVEDNSPCNYDHVESDLNTWHFYINGYQAVRDHIQEVVDKTYPGSPFNYTEGNVQSDAPLMNSECGAVWGIEGSAGDSDLAWHYRYMINEFRRHDAMCGFIFTEFHDVINEFNGYYRMDRQEKDFGYGSFCPGMSLRDLHSPDFIVIDAPPCRTVGPGQAVEVPLLASSYSDRYHGQAVQLKWELYYDSLEGRASAGAGELAVGWGGYGVRQLAALRLTMPQVDAAAVLAVTLQSAEGTIITRNFITFDVQSGQTGGVYALEGEWLSVRPASYSASQWEYEWQALAGHKLNGGGAGFVQYEIALPAHANYMTVSEIEVLFEAGAKTVLGKDKEMTTVKPNDISYMHGAKADPGMNINSYFMTDERSHSSLIDVQVDGESVCTLHLPDDPADSRGVLSWHYQSDDRKLDEAGSYGYLQRVRIPSRLAASILAKGGFTLRLSAESAAPGGEAGGLALYGRNAGRYPIDLLVCWK
ncbi:glycoside hydrolase family 2 [Paenibacillus doosanensis]|uniref:glycoside hydrolase family 2 protein n=1 Tax=Paenibacillus doosanensis TaxID=1229154 RepID=UPI0021803CDE|nr:sugar-binding domain-containing protein [Paenibacillus doosanensis]MCS7460497.1 glycoside hydrolase family 2 [Paenibacillus doosanensis]